MDPPTRDQLFSCTAAHLSTLLKERGQKVTGSKDAMVNRLLQNWHATPSTSVAGEAARTPSTAKPKYCCVPLCHNFSRKVLPDGSTVTLHRLPSSIQKRRQWVQRLMTVRKDLNITDNTRVCSEHFEGRIVDVNSIPSIFPSKPRKESKARRVLQRQTIVREDVQDVPEADDLGCAALPVAEDLSESEPSLDSIPEPKTRDIGVQVGSAGITHVSDAECQASTPDISFTDLKANDKKTRFYTGFVNYQMLLLFFTTLVKHGAEKLNYWEGQKRSMGEKAYHQEGVSKPGKSRRLSLDAEFLMVMMRLRLGLLQEHLADIFKVSTSTVSRTLITWINFMYDHVQGLIAWPTQQQILWNLPRAFQDFPSTQVVIDCTEFFIQKPSSLLAQNLTWSEYKHHNTIKVLIGVSPSGLVTFCSRVWGGRSSDRHITANSGLLPKIDLGMTIMGDKGFTIEDLLPVGVNLNMPPRIPSSRQMTSKEFFQTSHIASARIVVEMKMEQIKNYEILNRTISISEMPLAEQYIFICSALTNLLPPLLT